MFWWFERRGEYTRCEVLDLPDGTFEFRILSPDGIERSQLFTDATAVADQQRAVQTHLMKEGWSGPHGWRF